MLPAIIISLLAGMVLGQRFKVMILALAISVTLLLAIGCAIARAGAAWTVGLTAAVAIVGLQIGYMLAIVIRHLIAAVRRNRLRTASLGGFRSTRRPVH